MAPTDTLSVANATDSSWFGAKRLGRRDDLVYRVLDAAPIGMAITDHEGRLAWANANLCELLGYDSGDLLSLRLHDVVHPDDRPASERAVECLLSGECDHVESEQRWVAADGEVVWVLERASLHVATGAPADGPDADGQDRRDGAMSPHASPGDAVATPWIVRQVLDIRERRATEAALETMRAELTRRNEDLERSNADLAEFAYVVSHDLSEPLRVIAGHVALLEARYRGVLDDDATRWIGFAVDGCSRMRLLIDDLLAYSRAGRMAKEPQPLDLGEVVQRSLLGLRTAIDESGAVIEVGPLPTVLGDAVQLGQVVSNLIANSVKFRRPDTVPRIRIAARPIGSEAWRVRIEDDGFGIPERHRDRIFGAFQRLHRREDFAGTGIGLAICRKVLARHGGRIWVEESSSGGAAFCFTLMAAPPDEERISAPPVKRTSGAPAAHPTPLSTTSTDGSPS